MKSKDPSHEKELLLRSGNRRAYPMISTYWKSMHTVRQGKKSTLQ
jgi:hypothetical protein